MRAPWVVDTECNRLTKLQLLNSLDLQILEFKELEENRG
jgi:hypothetical protein